MPIKKQNKKQSFNNKHTNNNTLVSFSFPNYENDIPIPVYTENVRRGVTGNTFSRRGMEILT
jgi:hypothetical protein